MRTCIGQHRRTTALRAVLVAFAASCLLPHVARAEDTALQHHRVISVTGHGEVSVPPDLAVLRTAVETTAPKAADAVRDNATRSAKVATALKALLGKGDELTTTRYSLEPQYESRKQGQLREPRIIGYVARNEVQVRTHRIDAAGTLIDAAIAAGANRIDSLQFTLSNHEAPLRAALEKAATEAHAEAESVAKALGVRLKEVTSASTSAGPIVQPRYFERGFAAMEARAPTPIEAGTVSVSATLQVTYSIE